MLQLPFGEISPIGYLKNHFSRYFAIDPQDIIDCYQLSKRDIETMVTLYGIKNCDTMKKALAWCDAHGIEYRFHDYRKDGVNRERLLQWCKTLGWKTLVNTRGTTWRKFTPEQQDVTTQSKAVALMTEYPSLIKRPVVEAGSQLLVGFDPALFASFVK